MDTSNSIQGINTSNDTQPWHNSCFSPATSEKICITLIAMVAIGFVAMLITGVCGVYGCIPSLGLKASVYMIAWPTLFFTPPLLVGLYYAVHSCIAHANMHWDFNRRSNGR